jgi:ribonuclease D
LAESVDLINAPQIALDVETALGKEQHDLCLVQIGLPDPSGMAGRQLLFDCYEVDVASTIGPLLAARKNETLIHYASFETRQFAKTFELRIGGVYDTNLAWATIQKHAGWPELCWKRFGWNPEASSWPKTKVNHIADSFLDIELPKDEQTGDWRERPLRPEQLDYAARDVEILFPVRARAKELADELGIDQDISSKSKKMADESFRKYSEALRGDRGFYFRAAAILKRAGTAEQLSRLERACRALPLTLEDRKELSSKIAERQDLLRT